ncbi:MAG: GGDEF domain-containing protein [Alphaproteobacteria bacterium]|nr:GGDEF domain-containing protein [Alphaproteobacteria bacterium]MBV9692779.1 GGDEF domain-containing protein [Alphaproteobacteria bacterium]
MQDFQQEREQALAKTALALMGELGVAPTPDNFELFYTYASGSSLSLGQTIDEIISARRPFTSDVLDRLRQTCLSSARTTQALDNASQQASATLSAVLEKLEIAGRDAGDYGRTLSRASGELGGQRSPAELRTFVDTLIAATHTMENRTATLEAELQRSSQQVSMLKSQLDDVRKESLTDGLTAIANRKAFDTELLAAVAEAHETNDALALLMLDIDNFKKFNDTWGHQTGDQVLRLVAQCMSENVKGRDTVARFGGEEFAIVLRRTSLDNAVTIADQIRSYVESKRLVKKSSGDVLGTITISIGAARLWPDDTPASLVQRADECLYRAKRTGRNRVVCEADIAAPQIDAA